jgi:hypothetical protein
MFLRNFGTYLQVHTAAQFIISSPSFFMGDERNVYSVLMGKPEGKRELGRPRRRWEDRIRMDLREICWGSVDWIQFAQDRVRWRDFVNTVMNLRVLAPRSYFFPFGLMSHHAGKTTLSVEISSLNNLRTTIQRFPLVLTLDCRQKESL